MPIPVTAVDPARWRAPMVSPEQDSVAQANEVFPGKPRAADLRLQRRSCRLGGTDPNQCLRSTRQRRRAHRQRCKAKMLQPVVQRRSHPASVASPLTDSHNRVRPSRNENLDCPDSTMHWTTQSSAGGDSCPAFARRFATDDPSGLLNPPRNGPASPSSPSFFSLTDDQPVAPSDEPATAADRT